MKYALGFTGSFLILCLIITCIILPNMPNAQAQEESRQQQEETYSQSEVSDKTKETDRTEYILSEYNGVIAAYKVDQSAPIYISTVKISDLPETDRECLKIGIAAQSRRQLNKLIEEYCS